MHSDSWNDARENSVSPPMLSFPPGSKVQKKPVFYKIILQQFENTTLYVHIFKAMIMLQTDMGIPGIPETEEVIGFTHV
jgi:hypothetical protein